MNIFGIKIGNAFRVTAEAVTSALGYTPANNTAITGIAATGSYLLAAKPSINDTLLFDGVTFTFVAASGSAVQITIGATLATAIANALTMLNASTDVRVSQATYSSSAAGKIDVTHDTKGTVGNGYTLGTATGGNVTRSAATLTGGTDGSAQADTFIPQNPQSANYTTTFSDAGGSVHHPEADDNARTFTIDSNANVALKIGTTITFTNKKNTVTIAITTDTLTWANDNSTGSRTLAAGGMATAVKVTATEWIISGSGLT